MSVAERRARLGLRHRLANAARAASPEDVARDLVSLHGTDPATVFLSVAARMQRPNVAELERALYLDRSLVRMLGMRRTMFVVPDVLAPIVHAACTQAIAARLRRQYLLMLANAGVLADEDAGGWWARVEAATLVALRERGELTGQELGQYVPALKTQIRVAEGKSYAATQSVVTWMLNLLAAEGKVVRGRPRGSWISSQFRWAAIEAWLPDGLPELPRPAAQTTLVREWLRAFGPGAWEDLKWWTGLTLGEVRTAVAALDVAEVDLDGSVGLVLANDLEPVVPPAAWVALLPALDVSPMAYVQRDFFLGAHAPSLFDRSGNIGPSIWSDGRIVGGWAHRSDGSIAYRLLEDVGHEVSVRIEEAAHALGDWLGSVRVTPRFRTPLERELSA